MTGSNSDQSEFIAYRQGYFTNISIIIIIISWLGGIVVTLCAYEAEGPSSSPSGATHPTRC